MIFTLTAAFVSILIINKASRCKIFGFFLQTPILNIFRIYFGIPQIKLPSKHSSRIILVSFTLWCLVIRTAYQGTLFKFITTAMTKPIVRTLEELKRLNFTLFHPEDTLGHYYFDVTEYLG